jgi:DNA-binding PadR family transcriptional regulator
MSGPCGMHARGSVSEAAPRSVARGGIKFAILGLIKEKPRHGYDIIREMEESSGGLYSPSPGAVYPTLQALEEQGLLTSSTEEGKKVYVITEAGSAYLEQHKERADSHRERWESHWGSGLKGGLSEAVGDIKDALNEVQRAVRASASDPAKLNEIGELLNEAAAKIDEVARR